MPTNPYLDRDLNIIIDAYTRGVANDYIYPGDKFGPAALKNYEGALGGSYAQMSDRLQGMIDQAESAVDTLYGYGTAAKYADGVDVAGVNVNNTFVTLAKSGNFGEAAAAVFADCTPCKDRIMALIALNPLEEFWNTMDAMYRVNMDFVMGLWDLLMGDKSVRFFADICSLLSFLSFLCVPDLLAIAMTLSKLVTKYTLQLQDIQVTIQDLLGRVFGFALTPILGMFDKYIQLIVAPVECIITSINLTMAKVDVPAAVAAGISGETGKGTMPQLNSKEIAGMVGEPLAMLRGYMEEAVESVNAEFKKLTKEIEEWLGLQNDSSGQLLNITGKLEQVANIIGMIQAIIFASIQGGFSCGAGAENGEQELDNWVNNYFAPYATVNIVSANGTITITPNVPNELKEDIEKLVDIIGTYSPQKAAAVAGVLPEKPQVGKLVIPVRNCLYTTTDPELDKVRDFVSTLK